MSLIYTDRKSSAIKILSAKSDIVKVVYGLSEYDARHLATIVDGAKAYLNAKSKKHDTKFMVVKV